MAARPGIILQARVASHRLPGKALELIGGRPLVEQCLRRLRASGVRVVLATTERTEDAALVALAAAIGVPAFRGSESDVLDRFLRCAARFEIDPIVRATGDNPAVDMLAAGRMLAALGRTGADYVCEHQLPYGAAVEGVRASALHVASLLVRTPSDREHVTTLVRRRTDLFKIVELTAPAALAYPGLRFTVDTREDLQYVRGLYRHAGADMPTLEQLIAAAGDLARSEVA